MFIRFAGGVCVEPRVWAWWWWLRAFLRKSAIVAGLRGRHRLLRAVGDVSALRATDLQVFVSFESSLLLID